MSPRPSTPAPEPAIAAADLERVLGPSGTKRRTRRLLVLGLVAAVFLAGAWLLRARWSPSPADRPNYLTHALQRGDLAINVTANGTLQATRTVNVGSELSGTIAEVRVDVNDPVEKGQVLAVLDTSRLRAQIQRSSATLAAAQSRVAQAKATESEARATLERLEHVARLSQGEVPARTELDAARAALARARADLRSAQASVADAQAARSSDETNLGKATLRSPIDGIVLSRNVEPGNAVAASLQAVTLLTLATDLRQMKLQVKVDEADVALVQAGQKASFTVSSAPGRRFEARVTRVAFGSTITDNVVTYPTDLSVDNPDLSLRPGMTATASVEATRRTGVWWVPAAALRFTPTDAGAGAGDGGKGSDLLSRLMPRPPSVRKTAGNAPTSSGQQRQIWVLDGAQLRALTVTTGLSDGRRTEISGEGLREGLEVITEQASTATRSKS